MRVNFSNDLLSPERLQILEEADLKTLWKFLGMCKIQNMPRNALVNEIEKQIYKKWIAETNYHVDYVYKLDRNSLCGGFRKKYHNDTFLNNRIR